MSIADLVKAFSFSKTSVESVLVRNIFPSLVGGNMCHLIVAVILHTTEEAPLMQHPRGIMELVADVLQNLPRRKCSWHKLKHLLIIFGLLLLCVMTLIAVYSTEWKDENLKWEENFDTFDDSKWYYIVTGNRGHDSQFQYYRRDKRDSYVKNGTLHLKATLDNNEVSDKEISSGYQHFQGCNSEPCLAKDNPDGDCLLPVYSARVHTKHSFEIRRGRVEVGARFPSGNWLKAEIGLLPSENAQGGWLTSGRICIADVNGYENGHSLGGNTVRQSFQWTSKMGYNTSDYNKNYKSYWETTLPSGSFSDDFHVFEVEWSGTRVAFRVDGHETGKIVPPEGGFWELAGFSINIPDIFSGGARTPPFDRPFILTLMLTVGESSFERELDNSSYPKSWNLSGGHAINDLYGKYNTSTLDNPELEVDYIRVYEY